MVNNTLNRWFTLVMLLLSLGLTSPAFAWVDTDQDGVPDLKDACADTPPNTQVQANGCELVQEEPAVQTASADCDFALLGLQSADECHNVEAVIVYFEFAIADVGLSQWQKLALVKAFLTMNENATLTLVGHTDVVGTEAFNYQLSRQRAHNVKRILVEDYGFNPNRFTVIGKGITEPVAENSTAEGRRLNRRVQFIVNNY